MGILDHLEELRTRLVRSLLAVVIAFLACWGFSKPIFRFLAQPIYAVLPKGQKLVFLGVTDPFVLYMKVAGLAALFIAFPAVMYQIWRFVSPGLYDREKRWALPFIFFGTFFFVLGGVFAYYVAFPFAVEFLVNVGDEFQATITVDRYFKFLMTVILGLGVLFELPIFIFLLAAIGVVTPAFLMRHFRWAVIIIFFVSAILTPTPDIFNLCLFAVPTILLYLLGVGAAALLLRHRNRPAPDAPSA